MAMSASAILVHAIRAELRQRGITYRELAARLGVSEPTIKRDLGRGGFSLQRLDSICELLGLSLEDLIRNERSALTPVTELSQKQESALVADPKLLLTTYLILNNWRFSEIMSTFKVDENELVSLLLKLDTLKIIEYRPPDRIRKLTARNFSWRKDGPVHRYFIARVLPEFFGERFDGAGDAFHFVGATLSDRGVRATGTHGCTSPAERSRWLQCGDCVSPLGVLGIHAPASAARGFGMSMARLMVAATHGMSDPWTHSSHRQSGPSRDGSAAGSRHGGTTPPPFRRQYPHQILTFLRPVTNTLERGSPALHSAIFLAPVHSRQASATFETRERQ
jgi:transcriptional regulator with XRE-family HTH domain